MKEINMKNVMKKGIPVVLASTLVFSYGIPDVWAKGSNGKGSNGKGSNVKVEKKMETEVGFTDINGFWGALTVEKMNALGIIKGYDDGKFQPNKPVTQEEAIVMIIRLLGLEAEAVKRNQAGVSVELKNKSSISSWAKGYVDVAIELGIIDKNDKFQGNKPATRIYIVNLMIKALGLDTSSYSNYKLEFSDIAHLTAEEKLQLAVAVSTQLAQGSGDKKFNPNKPVTRGEMAAFLERMKDQLDDAIFSEYVKGAFVGVNSTAKTITVKQEVKNPTTKQTEVKDISYSLADQYVIYYEGKKQTSFDSFKVGDHIELILNKENKVIYVQGKKSKTSDDGIWTELKGVANFDVSITSGSNLVHYSYDATKAADVRVTTQINGQTSTLTGSAAAKAIRTAIDTHFKDDRTLQVHQVSKTLAAQVQTATNQEAQVRVHYKTTDKNMNFTVAISESRPSTTFTWTKDKATISYTQSKDQNGKVTSHLEVKDEATKNEVKYQKEVVGTTVLSATGYLKLNGSTITIRDTSLEPTIVQLLAGYKLDLFSQADQGDSIWAGLKDVKAFNLQVTSGSNALRYSYDANQAAQISVLTVLNGQTTTLTGNAAAAAVKTMIDTHLAENVQFDVQQASQTLANLVRANTSQEAQIQLQYKTTQKEQNLTVNLNEQTPSTIFTWKKGRAEASYTQTKDVAGKVVTQLDFNDADTNKEIRYRKEATSSSVTATGYLKINGLTITITDPSFESSIAQLLVDYKLKFSY